MFKGEIVGFKTIITHTLTIRWDRREREIKYILASSECEIWNSMTQEQKDFVVELISKTMDILGQERDG